MLVIVAMACSDTSRTPEAFCAKLQQVTGPNGVEVAIAPGDPARLDGIVVELNELLDRAPDEISTATAALVDFFERYQRAPRDERHDLLVQNEAAFISASQTLDDYALNECGLFLQRSVPTPVPTTDPGIDIAPE
jgi:hypothetical protein